MQLVIASMILLILLGIFYIIIMENEENESEEISYWEKRAMYICVEHNCAATKICPPP